MTTSTFCSQASKTDHHNEVVLRNVVSNFLTRISLAVVYLLCVPYILHHLGVRAYAVLSLCLVLVGYLVILDLGLSKGVVKFLAEYAAVRDEARIQRLLGTCLVLYCLLGLVGALLFAGTSGWLAEHVFNLPADLQATAKLAFYITSLGMLFRLPQVFFWSIPIGYQEIHRANNINLVSNGLRLLASIGVLYLGYALPAVVCVNVLATAFQLIGLYFVSRGMLPVGALRPRFDIAMARAVFTFSLKAGVSDLLTLLIVSLDKILIAIFMPIASLTFYTVPYELASRIWEVPNNIVSAAFPAFSALHRQDQTAAVLKLYIGVSKYIMIGAAFLSCFAAVFAEQILTVWIDPAFAQRSAIILRIFSVGILLSCSGWACLTLANGMGYPDIPAKVHAVMAALNIILCLLLIPRFGLLGAALAWLLQHLLDVFLMIPWVNSRVLRLSNLAYFTHCFLWPLIFSLVAVGGPGIISGHVAVGVPQLVLLFSAAALLYVPLVYFWVLSPEERRFMKTRVVKHVVARL